MKSRVAFLIVLVVWPCFPALAEKEGLFLLDNLQQRLNFGYLYNGRRIEVDGHRSSSSRHRFEESYRLDIDYAVYKPSILNGHLSLEGILDQEEYSFSGSRGRSGSDSGRSLRHDIRGTFFQWQPCAVTFFSRSEESHVSREFSSNYDQTVDSSGFGLNVKHSFLPLHVSYSTIELSTDGLARDYTRINENYSIGVSHLFRTLSRTSFNITANDNRFKMDGDPLEDRIESSDVALRNSLNWSSGQKRRNLHSALSYRREEGRIAAEERDSDYFNWSETLQWQLGKALESGLQYSRTDQEMVHDRRESQFGRLFLRHQFVQSLTTQFDLDGREDSLDVGSEEAVAGMLSFSYVKRLPERSTLLLQYAQRLGYVDRDFSGETITVLDEPHPVSVFAQILLRNPNVLAATVEVRDADRNRRLAPYVEGRDYQLDQFGQTTILTVLPGSDIEEGSSLLITYDFQADISGRYRETSRRIAGSLGLDDNALRLYGAWEEKDQDLLSGREEAFNLNGSSELTLGLESIRGGQSFGLEYKDFEFYFDQHQSWYGFYRISQPVPRGMVTLGLSDTYTIIEPIDTDNGEIPERKQNTFSLNTGFRGNVFARGVVLANAIYFNSRGDLAERDDVSLGLDYQFGFGKFYLTLRSKVTWRSSEDESTREDYLQLRLTRYF